MDVCFMAMNSQEKTALKMITFMYLLVLEIF